MSLMMVDSRYVRSMKARTIRLALPPLIASIRLRIRPETEVLRMAMATPNEAMTKKLDGLLYPANAVFRDSLRPRMGSRMTTIRLVTAMGSGCLTHSTTAKAIRQSALTI